MCNINNVLLILLMCNVCIINENNNININV